MTRSEVARLVKIIVGRWPRHAATIGADGSVADYVHALAPIAPEHARAAVDAWYFDGETFPPNGGQVLRKLADLALDAPDWGQVKAAILGWDAPDAAVVEDIAPAACPHALCDGDGMVVDLRENTTYRCRCWPDRVARKRARRARHPLVAEFLARTNPREFADIENDRIAEAQARQKWDAFVRGCQTAITYQGIDPAGLPQLERIAQASADRARLTAGRRGSTHRGPSTPDFLQLVQGGGQQP